ncbi:HAMP domain-containing sensor histidine kinase [Actinocorallia longicatena]|uniref:sensor histidine kinase n=1 Tax=Actinocorallia longicatena TaxID=111803 RepID=UPI0031E23D31
MSHGWSIRARLSLIASSVMLLVCLAGSAAALLAVRDLASNYRTEKTAAAALKIVHSIKRGHLPKVLPSALIDDLEIVQVVNAQGTVVAGSGTLGDAPRITAIMPPDDSPRVNQVRCDLPLVPGCDIVVAFRVYEPDGDWVVYAMSDAVPWYVSGRLITILSIATIVLVTATALGSARTVSRALKPVEDIRARAEEIGADARGVRMGERLPLPKHGDELYALTVSANGVLDRLERTIYRERRFTSDASHDLRSPITAMRAQLDEALLYPAETDWKETGQHLSASLDRLQAIVEDLLTLARIDSGHAAPTEPVALDELIRAEVARRRFPIPVELTLDPVRISGNPLQLTRLLTNLLDNAQRHAEHRVAVVLRAEEGTAVLEIVNDGDSIPAELREEVFRRFTRLDDSRSKDTGGTGLGLAIVREITTAHGGAIRVADSDDGARFVIRLPLLDA